MSRLHSFPDDLNVVVVGATGGIGGALLRLLAEDDKVAHLSAFARSSQPHAMPDIHVGRLDLEDESSIEPAAALAAEPGPLDLVIVASGILWREEMHPEKALHEIDAPALAKLFGINAIGPMLVAKHFAPKMRRHGKSVFACLSARVGSISDNRLGGWYSYRASKAALNMLLKTLAIEHARRFPESVIAGLHPGTVDTGLSRPYTGRTPPERLFTPESAAGHLLTVIDALQPADSGATYAWDGARIAA